MTDATGTNVQHPALVTATGPPVAPTSAVDATGTYSQHPALVTRPPFDQSATRAPSAAVKRKPHHRKRRRRHRHRRKRHGA